MSQQAGFIARLMRNGEVDGYDAWWVRGEDWRAAKEETDRWRMKAEANQRYLDEARGHLAVHTSLSVTLGDKVHDLESKLAAANLKVALGVVAASRSEQVRNLEKLLCDERGEHDEVVRKYSHKVDDLEELLNDERNEYEAVLGEKCSLLGKVDSLKESVKRFTEKVAVLEEEQRVVVEQGEEEGRQAETQQLFITPVGAKYKKTQPCSRRDWDEQDNRERAGEQVMWDGPRMGRPQPHEGDLMAIWRHKTFIIIYTITAVLDPSQRLDSWTDNVGQQTRSVLYLSFPKEVEWDVWIKMGGHKLCRGTNRIRNADKDIIKYYHN